MADTNKGRGSASDDKLRGLPAPITDQQRGIALTPARSSLASGGVTPSAAQAPPEKKSVNNGPEANSTERTWDGYPKLTLNVIERQVHEEEPYWKNIRNLRPFSYITIQDAIMAACLIAWNLTVFRGSEHGGIIFKHKDPKNKKPFGFVGPKRGIGWMVVLDLSIPKNTVYQALYHTHPDESGPSPDDHHAATVTNLPHYFCLNSGKISLYVPKQVSPDRRIYDYSKEIGIVTAPPNPTRFHSKEGLDKRERQLWNPHLKWRLSQMGSWLK